MEELSYLRERLHRYILNMKSIERSLAFIPDHCSVVNNSMGDRIIEAACFLERSTYDPLFSELNERELSMLLYKLAGALTWYSKVFEDQEKTTWVCEKDIDEIIGKVIAKSQQKQSV